MQEILQVELEFLS